MLVFSAYASSVEWNEVKSRCFQSVVMEGRTTDFVGSTAAAGSYDFRKGLH